MVTLDVCMEDSLQWSGVQLCESSSALIFHCGATPPSRVEVRGRWSHPTQQGGGQRRWSHPTQQGGGQRRKWSHPAQQGGGQRRWSHPTQQGGGQEEVEQGLTLRFQKHLPIGQVQVRFNLPECYVHLPKL
ncbi:unnamed protein product [Boreogadus saida]